MTPDSPIDTTRLLAESRLARVDYLPSISSTQDHAHRLTADQSISVAELPALVIADEQTSGRGRGANQWWTGRGSLAFSLIFDPSQSGLPRGPIPQASLAAGVAIIDAVRPWIGRSSPSSSDGSDTLHVHHAIGLHWPNDVFAAGKKLSGILIDVLPDGRHILGVGLNVNNTFAAAPEEVRARAVSLNELTGNLCDRTDVLLSFLHRLDETLSQLAREPETLGGRFDDLCLQVGHDLTIESASRRTTGRCAGIAPDGALLLDTLSGRQTFYSGVLR